MYTSLQDFNYDLPEQLIALKPPLSREQSKLLVVQSTANKLIFNDLVFNNILNYITPGDVVIFNDSKVIPARLYGKKSTGGKIELLIERILDDRHIIAHVKSNKHINNGLCLQLTDLDLTVLENQNGLFKLQAVNKVNWLDYLSHNGQIPIPPYLNRDSEEADIERYQTIYAKNNGSVAAPTAGLHINTKLLNSLKQKGVKIGFVTLHVGSGTFKGVMTDNIYEHKMHSEVYHIEAETLDLIHKAKANNKKIFAIGTTTTRVLETIAQDNYTNLSGETNIFITPGFKFKVVDHLVTNFHLPKSTLLMLVSAFTSLNTIKQTYAYAIAKKYRFFSYGDAMLLTKEE